MDELDKIDTNMLRQLQKDGRVTITELAKRVGLSKTPCQMRMRRLEEHGYILGYGALVDPSKLGAGHIAFVQVTLNDTKTPALEAFNRAVRAVPEIEQCHMIAGGFDYLLKVRTSDMRAYRRVHGEQISSLPHVEHTSTFVAMESIKDSDTQTASRG
jgi:Lrp/AsnC family leucine-responsive transcriptional regulator